MSIISTNYNYEYYKKNGIIALLKTLSFDFYRIDFSRLNVVETAKAALTGSQIGKMNKVIPYSTLIVKDTFFPLKE